MKIAVIAGATRCLGAPPDWDPNGPPCAGLPIRDDEVGGKPTIVSAWLPTPEEIVMIMHGQPVTVWVAGTTTPPISVQVGEPGDRW